MLFGRSTTPYSSADQQTVYAIGFDYNLPSEVSVVYESGGDRLTFNDWEFLGPSSIRFTSDPPFTNFTIVRNTDVSQSYGSPKFSSFNCNNFIDASDLNGNFELLRLAINELGDEVTNIITGDGDGSSTLDNKYLRKEADAGDQTIASDGSITTAGSVIFDTGGAGIIESTKSLRYHADYDDEETAPFSRHEFYCDGGQVASIESNGDIVTNGDVKNDSGDFRYLRLASGTFDQTVESTGTTTFDGLVEAGGGVLVAGGSDTIDNGFYGVNRLTAQHQTTKLVLKEGHPAVSISSTNITDGSVYSANLSLTFDGTTTLTKPFYNSHSTFGTTCNITSNQDVNGYHTSKTAASTITTSGDLAGFRSTISNGDNNGTGGDYNFYAAGDAPNFFLGHTYIGGNVNSPNISLLNDGRGEFGGGVKVSGGNTISIDYGLMRTGGGSLGIRANGNYTYVASSTGNIALGGTTPVATQQLRLNSDFSDGDAIGYYNAGIIQNNTRSASYIRSYLQEDISQATTLTNVKLFDADHPTAGGIDTNLTVTNMYGFHSNVRETSRFTNAYNFYAAGGAPNYFAGDIVSSYDPTHGPANYAGQYARLSYGVYNTYLYSDTTENSPFDINRAGAADGYMLSFGYINNFVRSSVGNIRLNGEATPDGLIFDAGGTASTAAAFVVSSDRRLKTNIIDAPSAVDLVKSLQPRQYDLSVSKNVRGFIADELQQVVPEAVVGTANAEEAIGTLTDADGVVTTDVTEPGVMPLGATWVETGTRPVYQGVDQTKLIPLLTKALQEALERIEVLEAAQ